MIVDENHGKEVDKLPFSNFPDPALALLGKADGVQHRKT